MRCNVVITLKVIVLLVLISYQLCVGFGVDNWYMLTTGSYILDNGIPYENPFTAIDAGYDIVIQQWLYCVAFRLFYDWLGWFGSWLLNACIGVLYIAAVCFAAKGVCGGDRRRMLDCVLIVLLVTHLDFVWRPHLVTLFVIAMVIGCLERYRRSSASKWLIPIPFLLLLEANCHAAAVPIVLAIIAVYCIPRVKVLSGHVRFDSYGRMEVFACLCLSVLAAFCNPYGIDGILYSVRSAGVAAYGNIISEMGLVFSEQAFLPSIFVVVEVAFGAAMLVMDCIERKSIDLVSSIVWFMLAVATCLCVRNAMILGVVTLPVIASALANDKENSSANVMARYSFAGLFVVLALMYISSLVALAGAQDSDTPENKSIYMFTKGDVEIDTYISPKCGVDLLLEAGAKPGDLVLTDFSTGGYVSFRGFRITLDSRPEVWDKAVAGKDDCRLFKDYVDAFNKDKVAAQSFVTRFDCDWAVLYSGCSAVTDVLERDESWHKLGESAGYEVWQHERRDCCENKHMYS